VLKPASATPLSTVLLAEVIHEAELPPGVFQFVVGNAREIAGQMIADPACRKITFTGSTEVGRELMRASADHVKKLSLELGGHAPVIVFEDADLPAAVAGTMIAKFRNAGQSCIAANRIYAQRSVFDRFVDEFSEQVKALRIGNGLDDGIDVGPLIDKAALDHALAHIAQAQHAGAEVVCGG